MVSKCQQVFTDAVLNAVPQKALTVLSEIGEGPHAYELLLLLGLALLEGN
jgi:hypothetical protein